MLVVAILSVAVVVVILSEVVVGILSVAAVRSERAVVKVGYDAELL